MLYYRNATVADDTIASVVNDPADNNQTGFYRPNNLIGVEERLVYKGIDDLELTAGLTYERERLSEGFSRTYSNSYLVEPEAPPKPAMKTNTLKSLYLQSQYKINKALTFTAGVRHEDSSYYDDVTTPRGSLVYNKDDTTIKFIYAEAFRAPKPWDYGPLDPTLPGTGNSDLEPEEMRSYELYFGRSFSSSFKGDITFYENKIESKLSKDSPNNKWTNQGELNAQGVELSLAYNTKNLKTFINYTYTDSEDGDGIKTDEIATNSASAGVTYKTSKDFVTHIGINYVGEKNNYAHEKVNDYTIANASFSYLGFEHWNIDFIVKNLFDEDYYHTSHRSVPKYKQAERSFFLRGGYKF